MSLSLTSSAWAGGAPYKWCDFGSEGGKFYGVGEISNRVTFFTGDGAWISPIPGFITYRKYYYVLGVLVSFCMLLFIHSQIQMKGHNKEE